MKPRYLIVLCLLSAVAGVALFLGWLCVVAGRADVGQI